jgi:hypothetical protein
MTILGELWRVARRDQLFVGRGPRMIGRLKASQQDRGKAAVTAGSGETYRRRTDLPGP